MATVFREFPTHGKLALEIDRAGLTLPQIAITANIIRCPMRATSRAILLNHARRRPFKTISYHSITGSKRDVQRFAAGLTLMAASPEDYLAGNVSANRLSFAIWVASNCKTPHVLADVSSGLQQGYRGAFSVNKLSDYINGHQPLWRPAKALLRQCLNELTRVEWEQPSLFDQSVACQTTSIHAGKNS